MAGISTSAMSFGKPHTVHAFCGGISDLCVAAVRSERVSWDLDWELRRRKPRGLANLILHFASAGIY